MYSPLLHKLFFLDIKQTLLYSLSTMAYMWSDFDNAQVLALGLTSMGSAGWLDYKFPAPSCCAKLVQVHPQYQKCGYAYQERRWYSEFCNLLSRIVSSTKFAGRFTINDATGNRKLRWPSHLWWPRTLAILCQYITRMTSTGYPSLECHTHSTDGSEQKWPMAVSRLRWVYLHT